ncbi:RNA binding protein, heterogenous nuclear RNP-K like protein, partial [Coemansia sp. Benny D115]
DDDGDDDDDGDGDDAKSDAEQNNGDKPSTAADTDNAAADTGATADSGTSVVTNAAAASVVATADGDNTARDATSGVAKETAADTETPAADTEKKPAEKPATKKSKYREDPSTRITLRMLVPHKCVGSIMGHGGKTINNIREASFVSIHTSETTLPRSSERIVAVIGTPKSIQKAIGLVAQALTKDMVSYNSTDHYVPAANLPSAMTVETHSRKRKDGNKRTGQNNNNNNNDHHPGNRGHSNNNSNSNNSHNHHHNNNRNSGARHNNHGQGGNFGNNRHQGNQRGGNSNYGNQMNYGRNQNNSGVIRHERHSRHNNDRMTGRNRAPNMMSPANRMPINAGPSQQGGLSQNQHGNNYRSSNMNNRPVSAPSAPYGGYNPPPTTTHPVYSAQGGRGNNTNSNVGGNVGGAGAGGVAGMHHSRYGGGNSAVSPVQAPSGYGTAGGYGATPAAYPFTAPANYGYPVSPVQNMYNNRAAQQPTSGPYNQRAFNTRGNRPQMQQQQQPQQQPHHQQYQNQYQHPVQNQNQHYQAPMGMGGGNAGAAGGGVPAANTAGQTIQQIYVPGDKVGAVIGRRGETINEIRHSTNARVDIQDSAPGAKERLIVISGGYDQVHSAYYMIKNKIDMARPATMRP